MRIILAIIILVLSNACSTAPTTKKIVGPDGTDHWLVTCTNIEKCYADARTACGGNYRIINHTSDTSGMTSIGGGLGYGYGFGHVVTGSVSTRQKILVKCDASAPRE